MSKYSFDNVNFKPFLFTDDMLEQGIDPVAIMMATVRGTSDVAHAHVNVTKPMAQKWLDDGNYNRIIRSTNIKELVEDMNSERWMLINQGIGFDTEGLLNDGQHTLTALIQSNLPSLLLPITCNINKEAMLNAWTHVAKRTVGDEITIQEHRVVPPREITILGAACINSLARIDTFVKLTQDIYREKVDTYNHRPALEWIMDLSKKMKGKRKNNIVLANIMRAYDWVMRSNKTDIEKQLCVDKLVRFCHVSHGEEPQPGVEQWAYRLYLYMNNAYFLRENRKGEISVRTDKGGQGESSGGSEMRQGFYLKVNRS